MALIFPSSPVDGQLFTDATTGHRYVYNATSGVWTFAANNVGMSISSTPPANVAPGALWYNREIGRTFVYYDDADSKQWVETVPATGSFDSSTVAEYANAAAQFYLSPIYINSNAAFDKANAALPNVSNSVFNGNLRVTGTLLVGTNTVTIKEDHIISAEYFRMNTANHMVVIPDSNRVNTIFTVANAAFDSANNVSPQIAPSYNTANAAFDSSNTLFSIANTNFATVTMSVTSLSDSSGTISWDAATSRMATVTLTGTGRTVANPTNLRAGSYVLVVKQDGSGSRTITTWGSAFKWPGAIVPVLSTAINTTDIFSFWCDGTNLYGTFIPDCR